VRCQACDDEILVAFSCKRRGICPSCTARRMADTAAHLVDRVLPQAPYRQWVLSVPKSLRLRLARDPAWTSWVGGLVVRAIAAWQRRVARARGNRTPLTRAITFVQRVGGLLNLNVHFHLVVPDGVFVEDGGSLTLVMLPVPSNTDVLAILDRIMRRIARRLANEAENDLDEAPAPDVFAQVQAEAAATWRSPAIASTSIRGSERLRAWCDGFSLHAAVVIADHDRDALERLCRYGARPSIAQDRLAWTAEGRISYKLKRPWPDGRTHLVMEPVAFLRRLVGIIPPPRRHLVRYAGVFGPASKHRTKLRALVPTDPDHPADPSCTHSESAHHSRPPPTALGRPITPRARRRRSPLPVRRAPHRRRVRRRSFDRTRGPRRPRPCRRPRDLRARSRPTTDRARVGRFRVTADCQPVGMGSSVLASPKRRSGRN
jgi:hypothetical protein